MQYYDQSPDILANPVPVYCGEVPEEERPQTQTSGTLPGVSCLTVERLQLVITAESSVPGSQSLEWSLSHFLNPWVSDWLTCSRADSLYHTLLTRPVSRWRPLSAGVTERRVYKKRTWSFGSCFFIPGSFPEEPSCVRAAVPNVGVPALQGDTATLTCHSISSVWFLQSPPPSPTRVKVHLIWTKQSFSFWTAHKISRSLQVQTWPRRFCRFYTVNNELFGFNGSLRRI